MRQALGPVRKGNFGVVMARVETGKTAWVLSEGSYLAEQADGHTLFLSNEEAGDAMMFRLYQATLGATREQILSNLSRAKAAFHKRVGHKLLFKDEARIQARWVEKTCEKYKPKLIIVDQIDKIQGFDNDREDLRLGAIYQFFRELAKMYAPVIGVTQANGEGANTKWLTMGHMSNSKTSKPAELDWLLGIGKLDDAGYENIRFMHLDKNKLPGGPESVASMRHGKWEQIINPEIVRYKDIGE
jgi:replicative DNA helicase